MRERVRSTRVRQPPNNIGHVNRGMAETKMADWAEKTKEKLSPEGRRRTRRRANVKRVAVIGLALGAAAAARAVARRQITKGKSAVKHR